MIDEKYLDALVIHRMTVSHQRAASGGKNDCGVHHSEEIHEKLGGNVVSQGNGEIFIHHIVLSAGFLLCLNVGQI